ncbi:MAG: glutamine-synthetase adenylyltransferase, partial [Rhodoferax sp.]|nr:glutamine-synthetase adenylyltransferase [Rhodoferax sp.]
NTAWTWEHQAMTRARFILGDDTLRQRFDAIRKAVIAAPRNADDLKVEIVTMRDKVRAAHPIRGEHFDVKHSPGGMIDVEFVMQHLVLSQAALHPELTDNAGNIALLERAETLGLLPLGVGHAAAGAYRELRRVQHRARLNEEPTHVVMPALQAQRDAVLLLWKTVFGSTGH